MRNRASTLVLVMVSLLGSSACAAQCEPSKTQSSRDVELQTASLEEDAYVEYFSGQPEKSIAKLHKLIDATTTCASLLSEPLRSAYRYQVVLERARLARQYEKLGDKVRARQETDRALELGRSLVPGGAWTPADLTALIERADANIRDKFVVPTKND